MTYEDHQSEVELHLRSRGIHLNIRTIEALSIRLRAEFREEHQHGISPRAVAEKIYQHLCRLRLEE